MNSTSPLLSLYPNGTLSISNRLPADIQTVPGNLVQCQPVYSSDPIVPGQFVTSAIDGAANTKWQPASAGVEASITVALPNHDNVKVKAFYFDWAQAPPVSFRVEFPNGSSSDNATSPMFYDPASAIQVASQDPVAVSLPFDEATVADVVPYISNTTLLTLHPPVAVGAAGGGAMYASLRITGNQGIVSEDKFNSSEVGGEVAEWGIIVDDDRSQPASQPLSPPPPPPPPVATPPRRAN
jgi:hypothetical protein